jgi:quercetin dioxygenase-like cupin family protein
MPPAPGSPNYEGAVQLAGLVDYQADAIVSKVLSKSAGGNVTLFAFAEGQELSEHTAPFEALIYVVDGVAEIGIGADNHRAVAGDLVRLPATVPHWVKAVDPFKMLLVMLREPGGGKTSP